MPALLTCQKCGASFKDRRGTKYCQSCRRIVKNDNHCNRCGIEIVKGKHYCDDCRDSTVICACCGRKFGAARKRSTQIFCSRGCRSAFYYTEIDHVRVVEFATRVRELEKKCEVIQSLLTAQQITTDQLIEQNRRLKLQLEDVGERPISPTVSSEVLGGKYTFFGRESA